MKKKQKQTKKQTKVATSPCWGDENTGVIAMNFVLSAGLADMINCVKYEPNRLRG